MSTDTDANGGKMEKINVRVPARLLETVDAEYERRGYSSRSEAIRNALRSWANPPVELSENTLEALTTSREQRQRGETRTLQAVADKYGVELDDES